MFSTQVGTLVNLTTAEACSKHGLTDIASRYSVDAREVVFTGGFQDGMSAIAIVALSSLGCINLDASKAKWKARTKLRGALPKIVGFGSENFQKWNHQFERWLTALGRKNSVQVGDILAEGHIEDMEHVAFGPGMQPLSGIEFAKVWEDGPYKTVVNKTSKPSHARSVSIQAFTGLLNRNTLRVSLLHGPSLSIA